MTKPKRIWSIQENARNIHRVEVKLNRVGDEFYALMQSDVHWDNPHCDQAMFIRHLQEARERDALVLDNGDFFCCMQGRFDKRSDKSALRPEHVHGDYLDALVNTATDALVPYKDLLGVRGQGNHETSVLKRHETNLTERLVQTLKSKGSKTVHLGGYSGYVVFSINHQGRKESLKLHYFHGSAGGPVTRGVIQSNRMGVFQSDADLVWTGHSHDRWQVPISKVRLNNDCTRVMHSDQTHFRTPGYKDEYGDGHEGWAVERGMGPKPIGAAWLRIWLDRIDSSSGVSRSIFQHEILDAK